MAFLSVWKPVFERVGAHVNVLCQLVWVFLPVFNSSGKQSGSVKALSWQDWYNPTRHPNTSGLQNQMYHPAFLADTCVMHGWVGGNRFVICHRIF